MRRNKCKGEQLQPPRRVEREGYDSKRNLGLVDNRRNVTCEQTFPGCLFPASPSPEVYLGALDLTSTVGNQYLYLSTCSLPRSLWHYARLFKVHGTLGRYPCRPWTSVAQVCKDPTGLPVARHPDPEMGLFLPCRYLPNLPTTAHELDDSRQL